MCRNTASSKIHSVKDADSLCELFLSPNDVPDILHPENVTPSITVFANAERLKSQPVKRQSSRIMPCSAVKVPPLNMHLSNTVPSVKRASASFFPNVRPVIILASIRPFRA